MSKHTPAPWHLTPGHFETNVYIKTNDLTLVATVIGKATDVERDANARLIVAAPDLLVLARKYASECAECDGTGLRQFDHGNPCDECADIRAVITRAELSPC